MDVSSIYIYIYLIVMNSWMSYKFIWSLIYIKKKYMFMFCVECLFCLWLIVFNLMFWLINGFFLWFFLLFFVWIEVNFRVI